MKTVKFFYVYIYILCFVLTSVIIISCGKENKSNQTTSQETKDDTTRKKSADQKTTDSPGKQLFYTKSSENNIACADCHSDGTNSGTALTKYFSNIQGADKRTSTYHGKFKGGEVTANAGGATVCWQEYMRMKTSMSEAQIKFMNEYYASTALTDALPELTYETIALPVKDKSKLKEEQKAIMELKGDPANGEKMFNNSCGFCHSENSTVKKVPGVLEEFEGNVKSITFNVRLGDGAMPFFKKNVLSNQEVADISAYLLKNSGQ
ncbi:MAG: c-type cytochrome [Ignavibacteria bacterium]